jgi:hypothetical protein
MTLSSTTVFSFSIGSTFSWHDIKTKDVANSSNEYLFFISGYAIKVV